ncbi:MAG: helix-turn-helix domain-containing protein [Brachymonas sp.]|nr:helix-turn-helix domain-containing protein [Brachymonas sp.]
MQPIQSTSQLGTAIRQRRQEAGLTLVLAAAACGVSVKFLQALETGKPTVQFDKALGVARHFGIQLMIA